MAWHSFHDDTKDLNTLLPNHPLKSLPFLPCFLDFDSRGSTESAAFLDLDIDLDPWCISTGAGAMNCHLLEEQYRRATAAVFVGNLDGIFAPFSTFLSEASLALVLALLELLLLLLVLLLRDDIKESLLIMLLDERE
ncbi:Hypothetical predicted protein [Olea europaea subsp. europaea]|uniref:Uncharacterized protein n=1 Tax=Olea europaea subsp. europaea TaxID=158383 RepID=A0A8S0T2Q4_OLEEU|nr:Hypothetical predicted protein [Olea europaea subsp. europaea]